MRTLALIPLALAGCADISLDNSDLGMRYRAEAKDSWDTSCPSYGDCEDFALCRARKLIEAGANPADITLTIVQDKVSNTGHAILTHQGQVYDNKVTGSYPVTEMAKRYQPLYSCSMAGQASLYIKDASGVSHFTGYQQITKQGFSMTTKCKTPIYQLTGRMY